MAREKTPSVILSGRVPVTHFDALCREAARRHIRLSDVIRAAVAVFVNKCCVHPPAVATLNAVKSKPDVS